MTAPKQKVAFHTLGCKLNYAETSTIARRFEAAGYEHIDFRDKADLYVINTCSVTENADREFRKIVHRAKRQAPDSKIAVIGCYAQLRPEVITETAAVDLVLGAKEKFNILEHLNYSSAGTKPIIIQDASIEELHGCVPAYSAGERTRSFLKIQDGCDYPCTYCTIPMARGKSRSLAPDILLQQIHEIVDQGIQEIVLTGVNVGDYSYGGRHDLLTLLKMINALPELKRVRISSIEPNLLTDDIIKLVAESTNILPHFHIPLQAGSDTILKLMKRRYGVQVFVDRIHKVRELLPNAGIGIDVIVGFPGEGAQEFQATYNLLDALDVSYLHVFTYSERPATPAIRLPGKVQYAERKLRNKRLTELSRRKAQTFALRQMELQHQVLTENLKNGFLTGMTENYIPVKIPAATGNWLNRIVNVELNAIKDQQIFGKLAELKK